MKSHNIRGIFLQKNKERAQKSKGIPTPFPSSREGDPNDGMVKNEFSFCD